MNSLVSKPAFWLFVVFLTGSGMVVGAEQLAYLSSQPAAWLLSLALLAVTAVPAGLLIYRFDQFEPEPPALILIALLWGGVVALAFAALSNSFLMSFLQGLLPANVFDEWGAALVAPLNEEFYKGAGLAALYLMAKHEINGLMDGLVYGAMIGLGFQMMENVQYFLHAASVAGGSGVGAVVGTYFARVVMAGLYSHTLFSGLMGFGFAYAVTQGQASQRKRLGVAALFAVLAWAAHFVWNSPWLDSLMGESVGSFALAVAVKGLPFVAFLCILGFFAHKREQQAFARLLATEVGADVLNEAEYLVLREARRRRAALRAVQRYRGPEARALLKQLQKEQIGLAVAHGKVDRPDHPLVEMQRQKIRMLKARMMGAVSPPRQQWGQ